MSNGGQFCSVLPTVLPDLFAVTAPVIPADDLYLPPAGAKHATIAVGGISDVFYGSTADRVRALSQWYKNKGSDADCYVFDMGHDYPPLVGGTPWAKLVVEYFQSHPRNCVSKGFEPPSYASEFQDSFDGVGALNSSTFRIQAFDRQGVLYGEKSLAGGLPSEVYGYVFQMQDG